MPVVGPCQNSTSLLVAEPRTRYPGASGRDLCRKQVALFYLFKKKQYYLLHRIIDRQRSADIKRL